MSATREEEGNAPARTTVITWVALAVLGLAYAVLASASLRETSITVDEFGHLPVGAHVLATGEFAYAQFNPPLMRVLSALPVVALDLKPSGTAPGWAAQPAYDFWLNGYHFMERYRADYLRAFHAARHVTVFAVGLLGLLVFAWARALVPERAAFAGLLAAALVWFSPGLLAHARLVTTDAGAATAIAAALFAGFRLARRPTLGRALVLGLALGAAMLVKFTAVYLYLLLPLQVGLTARDRPGSFGRAAALLTLAFAASVLVLNAGYGFDDVGRSLGEFPFGSRSGQNAARLLPDSTAVPLPAQYVLALDRQAHFTATGDPSYLLGEAYHGGRWSYFPVLLLLKTPLPLLLLGVGALWWSRRQRAAWARDAVWLLLPAGLIVAVFSLFTEKQIGVRQVLPALPLVWLWVACAWARAPLAARAVRGAFVALLVWWAGVLAWLYPDYLSSFNLLAGGPEGGHRVALDSNLDWGQDLIQLERYLKERGEERVHLLYFGRVDPALYGIDYVVEQRPGEPLPPLTAISLTLHMRSYFAYGNGALLTVGPLPWSHPALGEPIDRVGRSIRIFRTPDS